MDQFRADILYGVKQPAFSFPIGVRIDDTEPARRREYLRRMYRNRLYRRLSIRKKAIVRRAVLARKVAD